MADRVLRKDEAPGSNPGESTRLLAEWAERIVIGELPFREGFKSRKEPDIIHNIIVQPQNVMAPRVGFSAVGKGRCITTR